VIGNTNRLTLLGLVVPSRSRLVDDEIEGEGDTDGSVSPPIANARVAVAPALASVNA
jgi:hypothetical protein